MIQLLLAGVKPATSLSHMYSNVHEVHELAVKHGIIDFYTAGHFVHPVELYWLISKLYRYICLDICTLDIQS